MLALDTTSKKTVKDAFEQILGERKLTTVTVAHRLSTIVHSDKIVVIANGEIQECGTHNKLLSLYRIYTKLCKGQDLTVIDVTKSEEQIARKQRLTSKMQVIVFNRLMRYSMGK